MAVPYCTALPLQLHQRTVPAHAVVLTSSAAALQQWQQTTHPPTDLAAYARTAAIKVICSLAVFTATHPLNFSECELVFHPPLLLPEWA